MPTKAAMDELFKYGLDLNDVLAVLEEGKPSGRARKKGVFEYCLERGGFAVKVVVAESLDVFNKRDCWAVVHVGRVKT